MPGSAVRPLGAGYYGQGRFHSPTLSVLALRNPDFSMRAELPHTVSIISTDSELTFYSGLGCQLEGKAVKEQPI